MMKEITIRQALEADIAEIAAIYAHAVLDGTSSYELEPPSQSEMLARYRSVTGAGYPYLVADMAGRVAGYAYASAFRPRPAYRFIAEDSLYLAPDMQGRGLGGRLLGALVADVAAMGLRQLVAVIGDGRPDSPSVRLHRRLGFRMAGRLEGSGFKHGRWLDTAFMQLALNGGTATLPADAAQGATS